MNNNEEVCENFKHRTHRHEGNKRRWKHGTDRPAWCKVTTNLQVLKHAKSAKHDKGSTIYEVSLYLETGV